MFSSSFGEEENSFIGTIVKVSDGSVEVRAQESSLTLRVSGKVVCGDRELQAGSAELKKCLENFKGEEVQITSDGKKLLEVNLLEEIPQ